ncbi:hypothetical protein ACLB2K_066834 [Fragaria x ananassa]
MTQFTENVGTRLALDVEELFFLTISDAEFASRSPFAWRSLVCLAKYYSPREVYFASLSLVRLAKSILPRQVLFVSRSAVRLVKSSSPRKSESEFGFGVQQQQVRLQREPPEAVVQSDRGVEHWRLAERARKAEQVNGRLGIGWGREWWNQRLVVVGWWCGNCRRARMAEQVAMGDQGWVGVESGGIEDWWWWLVARRR